MELHVKRDPGVTAHISLTPECMIESGYTIYDGKYPMRDEYDVKVRIAKIK